VDVVGGLWEAVALAKQAAGIPQEDKVTVVEVSRATTSPLALLGVGASAASLVLASAAAAVAQGASPGTALQRAVGAAAMQQLGAVAAAAGSPFGMSPAVLQALLSGLQQGQVMAFDFDAAGMASGGSSGLLSGPAVAAPSSGSSLFDEDGLGSAVAAADAWLSDALEEWVL
jgi:protease-4